MNKQPIGILDSGLGGLTILQEIVRQLPKEPLVYVGDSANAPYGDRSPEEIYELAKRMIDFLLEKKAKLLVIACNTITVICLDRLRKEYPAIPIVGTVPVIKTAAAVTHNKRIAILSTTRTAKSDYQKELIELFAKDCVVFNHGTDLLVPFVERGDFISPQVHKTLQAVLEPLKKEQIDTLALGCTHFPFLREGFKEILGDGVQVLDSAPAIARQVKRILEHNKIFSEEAEGEITLYTTGDLLIAKKLITGKIEKKHVAVEHTSLAL